jgi:hypothetical protein
MTTETLIRRLDPERLGPEIREYVATCRKEGVFVSVIEQLVSKKILILTHEKPEPRPEVIKAIEDAELFAMNGGGARQ